jgi:16S rRNA (guanine966-N2)-methyltransferase
VREAVFNSLRSMDVLEGARVLDLFAGTGAMGIEALSRGAAHCVFVEADRAALAVLRTNLQQLGIADKSTVISGDAVMQASQQQGIDLLIADPPYGYKDWARLLVGVTAGLVVLESDREVGDIEGWDTVRAKKYGRTHVAFLQCPTTPAGTVEGE